MTPEDQQKVQQELDTLKAYRKEHRETAEYIRSVKLALEDRAPFLRGTEDKALYVQSIAKEQQRLDRLDQTLGKDFGIVRDRSGYNINKAIAEREQQLGIQPQEKTLTPTVGDWKQSADQRAGQSPTAQELIKNMTACRDIYGNAQDILNEAARNNVHLSEVGKQWLLDQQHIAQEGFESNKRAYEARVGALSPGNIPQYVSLREQLSSQELEQMARKINSKAFRDLYKETPQQEATRLQRQRDDYSRDR